MTRSMNDISDDEESPSDGMSSSQFCTTLDDAERAVNGYSWSTVGEYNWGCQLIEPYRTIHLAEALRPVARMSMRLQMP